MEGQYSEKVMEHFRNPHNVGEIPDASGIGNVGNPVCVPADTLISRNSSLGKIKDVEKGSRNSGRWFAAGLKQAKATLFYTK